MVAKKERDPRREIAVNRKARFHYEIGETFEAGIALTGTEVKSLRVGKATIAESYADARGNVRVARHFQQRLEGYENITGEGAR